MKHQQQQQRKQQQKQVKFVDSDYEEDDDDLQDLDVQAGPNEKKDRKLLAQRYPKYHYQNRNRNGKLTILKKLAKQQKVYKKQQLKRPLEEQHTEDEDEDEFGDNDNELNQFLE